jgi:probable F420-dependent oxidoreductase
MFGPRGKLTGMDIGKIGIWKSRRTGTDGVREIEALGYGALWLGGSPSVEQTREYVEAAERLPVLTGILNVWQHEPADVAAAHARLVADHPDRFVLGLGIGHPEATSDYTRPLASMRAFLDGLDAAETPVPPDQRLLAALGPKMLDLAAERTLGTHPYFIHAEHTRYARERVGAGVLVAPEVAVVVEPDAEAARRIARDYAANYLRMSNYTSNLLRHGFTEDDVRDGGSDRLIDAVIPHGTPEAIADAVRAHLDAGADHVCLQPLGHGPAPVDDYAALAEVLVPA